MSRKYIWPPEDLIFQYLDNVGDGSGYVNFNHEYSASAASAIYTCDEACELHALTIELEDTKTMQSEEYGDLGSALATGFDVLVKDSLSGSTVIDLTDSNKITTNAGLARLFDDLRLLNFTNTTNAVLSGRLDFRELMGQPLYLPKGYSLQIPFVDDLTGLIEHYFKLSGRKLYRKGAVITDGGIVDLD